jgi:Cys-rich repeat protein
MNRARLGALLALVVAEACNGEFRFDDATTREASTAGSGTLPTGGTGGLDGATSPSVGGCADDTNGCAHCLEYGLHCADEWQACVECVENVDCAADVPYCDPALHRCTPCNTSSGCDPGNVCDGWGHSCMPSCATASAPGYDCDGGPRMCDEQRNVCVLCHDDDDCLGDPLYPHCAPGGARCAECASDRDCPTGRRCDPLEFACVVCRDSRDCAAGSVCDPATHTCLDTIE